MPMKRSRRNFYFWILITTLTLAHWVVECDKLDGYSFPVYNTTSCPSNQSEWRNRSSAINCTENNGYMCIPNENVTELLEFCYRYPRIPIEKNICLILKKSTSLVEAYSCKQFRNGCPEKQYWSYEIFEYPSCLSIGHGCFLDEPLCKDEGIPTIGPSETKITQGTTNGYLGSTILNTSLGNTPIPDIDGSNAWVLSLVIGVFVIIVFVAVCVPVIILIKRDKQRTLGGKDEGHKEEETIPLKMDSSGEREIFNTDKIRERTEKEEGVTKSNDESLKTDIAGEHENTLQLDEISEKTDTSSESCSEKENFSLDEEVPEWNSRNTQQEEESDRIIPDELEMVGIYLDDYEIWKTEISEKYKKLSNEERAALFLILCSNKNTFILEKTETLTKRESIIIGTLEVSKNISYIIQILQSKGLVSIENEEVTFASEDVQDETMFDYVHTSWKKKKVYRHEESMFKYMFKDNNREMFNQYGGFMKKQLLNVSLDSSVKYFRSQNYHKGKFVRFLREGSGNPFSFLGIEKFYEELLTRIIFELGKDILIHGIVDDKSLHSTISSLLKIPEEVLQWDLDARSRYLEYLKKGKTPIYRARGMIVGCAGAGKTTLLERLQGKSLEDIQKINSTVGLDVHNDIFEVLENERKLEVAVRKCEPAIHIKENVPIDDAEKVEEKRLLSILDFGGQCMYYACHQIYLSKRAFYILVVDMSKDLEDVIEEKLCDQKDTMFSKWSNRDYLLFWLKSVNCYCADKAPVILVATHAEEKSEQEKTEYYQELTKMFPVSSTIKTHLSSDRYFTLSLKKHNGACIKSLDELERSIVEVVMSQKHWGEEIPLDWAIFEKFISEEKKTKLQKLDKLKESFDKLLPLSRQEFKDLLHFYHDIGVILYFSSEDQVRNSPEIVILDIQWFVDSFKYVMTDSKQASFNKVIDAAPTKEALDIFTTTGEFSGTFLKAIWTVTKNQTAVEYKDNMMKYMERLGLMAIEEKSDICFIPSMNRMKVPLHVKSRIQSHPNKSPTLYIRFPVLPVFLFYRLIVLCLKSEWKPLSDRRKCIYIDAAMFYYQEHVLVLAVSESYIQLLLYNDDDQTQEKVMHMAFISIKRKVTEMLSSLTKTFNSSLHYQVGYSCTPAEFGKELDGTFMTENVLFKYNGKKCPLHAQKVKKSALTLTIEEEEFKPLQHRRKRHLVPFMKEFPSVFSDQPYHLGQAKKRSIYTEPHQVRNDKKRPKRSAPAPALLSLERSAPAPALLLSERSASAPALLSPEKSVLVPPLPPSEKSTSSLQSKSSSTTDTPRKKSFKRLFGDTLRDASDKEDLLTPDVSITEPPVTSTPCRTIMTITEREYDERDVSVQTSPCGSPHPSFLVSQELIGLDVGGKLFVTTVATLRNHPDSLFAKMTEDLALSPSYVLHYRGNLKVYFIDRDSKFFNIILHYLRYGAKNINCLLPNDARALRRIYNEAVYYKLDTLAEIIGSQMSVMILGHKEFLD